MKKPAIVLMLCVNAVLLVALVAGTGVPKAYGQFVGANYLVVTGDVYSDYEAVYVLDLATRRVAAWRYQKRRKPFRLVPVSVGGGRELLADFGRSRRRQPER